MKLEIEFNEIEFKIIEKVFGTIKLRGSNFKNKEELLKCIIMTEITPIALLSDLTNIIKKVKR